MTMYKGFVLGLLLGWVGQEQALEPEQIELVLKRAVEAQFGSSVKYSRESQVVARFTNSMQLNESSPYQAWYAITDQNGNQETCSAAIYVDEDRQSATVRSVCGVDNLSELLVYPLMGHTEFCRTGLFGNDC